MKKNDTTWPTSWEAQLSVTVYAHKLVENVWDRTRAIHRKNHKPPVTALGMSLLGIHPEEITQKKEQATDTRVSHLHIRRGNQKKGTSPAARARLRKRCTPSSVDMVRVPPAPWHSARAQRLGVRAAIGRSCPVLMEETVQNDWKRSRKAEIFSLTG